ncbi:uncharacterized protein H6S33_011445 [Morchella sextelata]|uniref:uncharacterized protein n=1 Tax=Morchella sextelata TaxID=1174677 RepID=UPI001D044EFE|nr:uncharacterized protein H6S33_011445 [Morchella sextelata]KAH0611018.1 hypothetical protein H6S33_011445 [Morchella sextelata]
MYPVYANSPCINSYKVFCPSTQRIGNGYTPRFVRRSSSRLQEILKLKYTVFEKPEYPFDSKFEACMTFLH